MLVVGDDLVFVGGPLTDPENLSIANPALMSRDIATGDLNWTYNRLGAPVIVQNLATDGEHVYALLFSAAQAYPDAPVTYRLVALDGETGDVRWETPTLEELTGLDAAQGHTAGQPVIVGDTVVMNYGPEVLIALDRESGDVAWIIAPDEVASYPMDMVPMITIAANERHVYRALPSGVIQEIDIATGEIVQEFGAPIEGEAVRSVSIHLQGDSIVVVSGYVADGSSSSRIDVYETATKKGGWTSVRPDTLFGEVVVTENAIVVAEAYVPEPSLLERILPFDWGSNDALISVISLDLATGEDLDLFADAELETLPSISAAANTVCLAANTMRCVDPEDNEMQVEEYKVEAYAPFTPPVYWEGQIIIGNGMGPLTVAKPVE